MPSLSQAGDENPLSFNVGAVTDYRYRGISQTRLKPALQGGADYAHPSGFYVGTWLSTIKWIKDCRRRRHVEVGPLRRLQGRDRQGPRLRRRRACATSTRAVTEPDGRLRTPNTTEIYGALTYGPATLKYSHSVTNLFGTPTASNSGYLDLGATFDVGTASR